MNIDWSYPINGIYVSSHPNLADYWRDCREQGYNIQATWLDKEDTPPLLRQYEAGAAQVLIFYYGEGDEPPTEHFYEVGAAIANGRVVLFAGGAILHGLAQHPNVTCLSLPEALTHAQNLINNMAEAQVNYLETYAHVEYRKDTRPALPFEADIVAISSHASTKDNAIVLPYPNGLTFAMKLCQHIDDAMARAFQLGSGNGQGTVAGGNQTLRTNHDSNSVVENGGAASGRWGDNIGPTSPIG